MLSLFIVTGCLKEEMSKATEEFVDSAEQEVVTEPLDLETYEDNLKAFIKTRGSLNPEEEIVFYWDGYIYKHEFADPEAYPQTSYFSDPILRFEGFNIARFVELSDGEYQMLTREITVYKNLQGKIIDCWNNRKVGVSPSENVRVIHVQNEAKVQ